MEHQQILERAIRKAIERGWEPFEVNVPVGVKVDFRLSLDMRMQEASFQVEFNARNKSPIHDWNFTKMLFNHDFARAIFGNDNVFKDGTPITGTITFNGAKPDHIKAWQYYLQQMVIADDPIKYLGAYIAQPNAGG